MTTNRFGNGRVTYIGTVPDRTLARGLADWVAATSLPADDWRHARPSSVTCTSAAAADGSVVRFVLELGLGPEHAGSCRFPSAISCPALRSTQETG